MRAGQSLETGDQSSRIFRVTAGLTVLLTIPALVLSGFLLFHLVFASIAVFYSSLRPVEWALVLAAALVLPVLCILGPATAHNAMNVGRVMKAWAWLSSPLLVLIALFAFYLAKHVELTA